MERTNVRRKSLPDGVEVVSYTDGEGNEVTEYQQPTGRMRKTIVSDDGRTVERYRKDGTVERIVSRSDDGTTDVESMTQVKKDGSVRSVSTSEQNGVVTKQIDTVDATGTPTWRLDVTTEDGDLYRQGQTLTDEGFVYTTVAREDGQKGKLKLVKGWDGEDRLTYQQGKGEDRRDVTLVDSGTGEYNIAAVVDSLGADGTPTAVAVPKWALDAAKKLRDDARNQDGGDAGTSGTGTDGSGTGGEGGTGTGDDRPPNLADVPGSQLAQQQAAQDDGDDDEQDDADEGGSAAMSQVYKLLVQKGMQGITGGERNTVNDAVTTLAQSVFDGFGGDPEKFRQTVGNVAYSVASNELENLTGGQNGLEDAGAGLLRKGITGEEIDLEQDVIKSVVSESADSLLRNATAVDPVYDSAGDLVNGQAVKEGIQAGTALGSFATTFADLVFNDNPDGPTTMSNLIAGATASVTGPFAPLVGMGLKAVLPKSTKLTAAQTFERDRERYSQVWSEDGSPYLLNLEKAYNGEKADGPGYVWEDEKNLDDKVTGNNHVKVDLLPEIREANRELLAQYGKKQQYRGPKGVDVEDLTPEQRKWARQVNTSRDWKDVFRGMADNPDEAKLGLPADEADQQKVIDYFAGQTQVARAMSRNPGDANAQRLYDAAYRDAYGDGTTTVLSDGELDPSLFPAKAGAARATAQGLSYDELNRLSGSSALTAAQKRVVQRELGSRQGEAKAQATLDLLRDQVTAAQAAAATESGGNPLTARRGEQDPQVDEPAEPTLQERRDRYTPGMHLLQPGILANTPAENHDREGVDAGWYQDLLATVPEAPRSAFQRVDLPEDWKEVWEEHLVTNIIDSGHTENSASENAQRANDAAERDAVRALARINKDRAAQGLRELTDAEVEAALENVTLGQVQPEDVADPPPPVFNDEYENDGLDIGTFLVELGSASMDHFFGDDDQDRIDPDEIPEAGQVDLDLDGLLTGGDGGTRPIGPGKLFDGVDLGGRGSTAPVGNGPVDPGGDDPDGFGSVDPGSGSLGAEPGAGRPEQDGSAPGGRGAGTVDVGADLFGGASGSDGSGPVDVGDDLVDGGVLDGSKQADRSADGLGTYGPALDELLEDTTDTMPRTAPEYRPGGQGGRDVVVPPTGPYRGNTYEAGPDGIRLHPGSPDAGDGTTTGWPTEIDMPDPTGAGGGGGSVVDDGTAAVGGDFGTATSDASDVRRSGAIEVGSDLFDGVSGSAGYGLVDVGDELVGATPTDTVPGNRVDDVESTRPAPRGPDASDDDPDDDPDDDRGLGMAYATVPIRDLFGLSEDATPGDGTPVTGSYPATAGSGDGPASPAAGAAGPASTLAEPFGTVQLGGGSLVSGSAGGTSAAGVPDDDDIDELDGWTFDPQDDPSFVPLTEWEEYDEPPGADDAAGGRKLTYNPETRLFEVADLSAPTQPGQTDVYIFPPSGQVRNPEWRVVSAAGDGGAADAYLSFNPVGASQDLTDFVDGWPAATAPPAPRTLVPPTDDDRLDEWANRSPDQQRVEQERNTVCLGGEPCSVGLDVEPEEEAPLDLFPPLAEEASSPASPELFYTFDPSRPCYLVISCPDGRTYAFGGDGSVAQRIPTSTSSEEAPTLETTYIPGVDQEPRGWSVPEDDAAPVVPTRGQRDTYLFPPGGGLVSVPGLVHGTHPGTPALQVRQADGGGLQSVSLFSGEGAEVRYEPPRDSPIAGEEWRYQLSSGPNASDNSARRLPDGRGSQTTSTVRNSAGIDVVTSTRGSADPGQPIVAGTVGGSPVDDNPDQLDDLLAAQDPRNVRFDDAGNVVIDPAVFGTTVVVRSDGRLQFEDGGRQIAVDPASAYGSVTPTGEDANGVDRPVEVRVLDGGPRLTGSSLPWGTGVYQVDPVTGELTTLQGQQEDPAIDPVPGDGAETARTEVDPPQATMLFRNGELVLSSPGDRLGDVFSLGERPPPSLPDTTLDGDGYAGDNRSSNVGGNSDQPFITGLLLDEDGTVSVDLDALDPDLYDLPEQQLELPLFSDGDPTPSTDTAGVAAAPRSTDPDDPWSSDGAPDDLSFGEPSGFGLTAEDPFLSPEATLGEDGLPQVRFVADDPWDYPILSALGREPSADATGLSFGTTAQPRLLSAAPGDANTPDANASDGAVDPADGRGPLFLTREQVAQLQQQISEREREIHGLAQQVESGESKRQRLERKNRYLTSGVRWVEALLGGLAPVATFAAPVMVYSQYHGPNWLAQGGERNAVAENLAAADRITTQILRPEPAHPGYDGFVQPAPGEQLWPTTVHQWADYGHTQLATADTYDDYSVTPAQLNIEQVDRPYTLLLEALEQSPGYENLLRQIADDDAALARFQDGEVAVPYVQHREELNLHLPMPDADVLQQFDPIEPVPSMGSYLPEWLQSPESPGATQPTQPTVTPPADAAPSSAGPDDQPISLTTLLSMLKPRRDDGQDDDTGSGDDPARDPSSGAAEPPVLDADEQPSANAAPDEPETAVELSAEDRQELVRQYDELTAALQNLDVQYTTMQALAGDTERRVEDARRSNRLHISPTRAAHAVLGGFGATTLLLPFQIQQIDQNNYRFANEQRLQLESMNEAARQQLDEKFNVTPVETLPFEANVYDPQTGNMLGTMLLSDYITQQRAIGGEYVDLRLMQEIANGEGGLGVLATQNALSQADLFEDAASDGVDNAFRARYDVFVPSRLPEKPPGAEQPESFHDWLAPGPRNAPDLPLDFGGPAEERGADTPQATAAPSIPSAGAGTTSTAPDTGVPINGAALPVGLVSTGTLLTTLLNSQGQRTDDGEDGLLLDRRPVAGSSPPDPDPDVPATGSSISAAEVAGTTAGRPALPAADTVPSSALTADGPIFPTVRMEDDDLFVRVGGTPEGNSVEVRLDPGGSTSAIEPGGVRQIVDVPSRAVVPPGVRVGSLGRDIATVGLESAMIVGGELVQRDLQDRGLLPSSPGDDIGATWLTVDPRSLSENLALDVANQAGAAFVGGTLSTGAGGPAAVATNFVPLVIQAADQNFPGRLGREEQRAELVDRVYRALPTQVQDVLESAGDAAVGAIDGVTGGGATQMLVDGQLQRLEVDGTGEELREAMITYYDAVGNDQAVRRLANASTQEVYQAYAMSELPALHAAAAQLDPRPGTTAVEREVNDRLVEQATENIAGGRGSMIDVVGLDLARGGTPGRPTFAELNQVSLERSGLPLCDPGISGETGCAYDVDFADPSSVGKVRVGTGTGVRVTDPVTGRTREVPECTVDGQQDCVRDDDDDPATGGELIVGSGGPTRRDDRGRVIQIPVCGDLSEVMCRPEDAPGTLRVGTGGTTYSENGRTYEVRTFADVREQAVTNASDPEQVRRAVPALRSQQSSTPSTSRGSQQGSRPQGAPQPGPSSPALTNPSDSFQDRVGNGFQRARDTVENAVDGAWDWVRDRLPGGGD